MKIYVDDWGWAGAKIWVLKDDEEARQKILLPMADAADRAYQKHEDAWHDPSKKQYDPDRKNPTPKDRGEKIRNAKVSDLLKVYEIEHGLMFSTDGE